MFYRGKSDDQGEDDDEGYEGPPFKWHGPIRPPRPSTNMTPPDDCTYLERKIIAARRMNSDAPELTCDSKMRQIAELHGQNMAGRV